MSKDADEDIVASGEALRTVASWLGVGNVDDVLEKEGLNPEFEMGRTQGLGLGAKFLPHHKAVALTSGVEHRLSSKLKRSAERQMAAASQSGSSLHGKHSLQHAGKFTGPGRGWREQAQRQEKAALQASSGGGSGGGGGGGSGKAEADESTDEEEEGRGKAFKGRQAAQKPGVYSRSDLLKTSEAAHGKKRKRKGG